MIKLEMKKILSNQTLTFFLIIASYFLVSFLLRYNLLDFPFERDEGEFSYLGNLILEGIAPYRFEGNFKLPGASYFYAIAIALLGSSNTSIHTSLIFLNVGSAIATYILFLKFKKNERLSYLAGLITLILLSGQPVLGFALHATQIQTPFIVFSFIFLINFLEKFSIKSLILSGLCLSIAIMIKQTAILLLPFYFYILIKRQAVSVYSLLLFLVCCFIFPIVLILSSLSNGTFINLRTWVIDYGLSYGSGRPLSNIMQSFKDNFYPIARNQFLFWLTSLIGLFSYIYQDKNKKGVVSETILAFAIAIILTIFPSFWFRPHYFVPILPLVAIFSAIGFQQILKRENGVLMILISGFIQIMSLYPYYISTDVVKVFKKQYPNAPFLESVDWAEEIKNITTPNDKIFILANEPQIYYYSERKSASSYLYMFPLIEPGLLSREMQHQAIKEVEKYKPAVIIRAAKSHISHARNSYYPLMQYIKNLTDKNYKIHHCYNIQIRTKKWIEDDDNCNLESYIIYTKSN